MLIRPLSLNGEVTVLDVSGRLTIEAGVALGDAVGAVLCTGCRFLVLNLIGVTAVDAAGLGELAHAVALARAVGGALQLVVCDPTVHELLSRTRLLGVLRVFPTEAEAIRSFEAANCH
jgi:anti-anti-sigma factor